jgi:hypothetical protein
MQSIDQVTSDLRRAIGLDGFPRAEGALALVHSLFPTCRVQEVRGLAHAFLWRTATSAIIYSPPGDWLGQTHEVFHVLTDDGLAALLGQCCCVTASLACAKEESMVNRALRAFLMPAPLCIGLDAWELAECAQVPHDMALLRLREVPWDAVETEVGFLTDEEEEVRRWHTR